MSFRCFNGWSPRWSKVSQVNLDQAGRFVSLLDVLAGARARLSNRCRCFGLTRNQRWLILSLVVVSPFYIFWSRAFMIESTALLPEPGVPGCGGEFFAHGTLEPDGRPGGRFRGTRRIGEGHLFRRVPGVLRLDFVVPPPPGPRERARLAAGRTFAADLQRGVPGTDGRVDPFLRFPQAPKPDRGIHHVDGARALEFRQPGRPTLLGNVVANSEFSRPQGLSPGVVCGGRSWALCWPGAAGGKSASAC
jgi:hypothetical protein